MTSSHRAVAVLATAFVVLGAAPLSAHEEAAVEALAVIHEVRPATEGIEVRVFQLTAPTIVVTNESEASFVVFGLGGEPFLRIQDGTVETNRFSPTSYRALDPTGERPLPGGIDPQAPPEWVTIARAKTWSWFDPRAAYSPGSPEWSIPIEIDGSPGAIDGDHEPIEGHGHLDTRLVDRPRIEGLELRLLDAGVPAVFVRNTTGRVLHIPGRAGEPFLRVGPRGVFGNQRSPDFYAAGGQTVREAPAGADPDAPPRWRELSSQPVWQWLEYRARLPASAHQRAVLGAERKVVLRWETPLRLGTDDLELSGEVVWLPPRTTHDEHQGTTLGSTLAAIVGAAVAAVLLFVTTRRLRALGS